MSQKIFVVAGLLVWLTSCADTTNEYPAHSGSFGEANTDVTALERDFMKWWTYFNEHIALADDFVALDTAANVIAKEAFLASLATGKYLPVKLTSFDSLTYLQLHLLAADADSSIVETISGKGEKYFQQFKQEGMSFPDFAFTSLAGKEYNRANTSGKLLVVKCWYIRCGACIKEFPELKQLVERHAGRDDVEFISLAFDAPDALRRFMADRDFGYSVVPVGENFLEEELGVYIYPTHIIVDQQGVIKKVVNSYEELALALAKLT